jgi:hypothetical protein
MLVRRFSRTLHRWHNAMGVSHANGAFSITLTDLQIKGQFGRAAPSFPDCCL